MANNPNSPDVEAMNLQALSRGLEKVLEYRKATNAAGLSCPSPPMRPSALCEKLASIVNSVTSPRKANGFRSCFPSPGRSRGLSPSPSASSDSSISGGVLGFLSANSTDGERNKLATGRLRKAASATPIYGRGGSSDRIAAGVTQPRVVEQMPNLSRPSSAPASGRGRTGVVSPSTPTGGAPQGRVPKKRKRPSKKPPTTKVEATVEDFRATVQQLTGCKKLPAPVLRPQPARPRPERAQPESPQANAVPIEVGLDLPAKPGSSSTSMLSAVHSPSPTVFNRVPEATFSIRDSSTAVSSSSMSSSLNDCMGYGGPTPRFLEDHDYDENLGQLPDDSLQPNLDYISEPIQYKKHEVTTTAASSTAPSVKEAAPLPSESNGKEGIPREHTVLGSNINPGSGSPISHDFTRPPAVFGFNHRPLEMDSFEMEFDHNDEWLANSIFSDYP